VLKALGARNSYLYTTVIAQALISVAIGVGVGTIFTWLVSKLILGLGLNLTMNITAISLVKVGSLALLISGFSAVLPIRQISKLDPATVFRGR
jgi:ABC-type antimicrobial peptide transport system permease subunit